MRRRRKKKKEENRYEEERGERKRKMKVTEETKERISFLVDTMEAQKGGTHCVVWSRATDNLH